MFDFDELEEEEGKVPQSLADDAADGGKALNGAAPASAGARKPWRPLSEEEWRGLPPRESNDRPKNMKEFKAVVNERAPGEYFGLEFPFTPTMLREMGPEWLTKAMHTAGTLPKGNAVTSFVSFEVKADNTTEHDHSGESWGGAGVKVLLKVAYREKDADLSEEMFIKIPHEHTGKNERFKLSVTFASSDWSEVTFYNVFGGHYGDLPVRVPKMIFCDMNRRTTNFIIITERVHYAPQGTSEVLPGCSFPAPHKYRDWSLPDNGVEHYYAHARTLARFFGWHRHIRQTTDQIEKLFMEPGFLSGLQQTWSAMQAAGPYNSQERDNHFVGCLADPNVRAWVATMAFNTSTAEGFLDMSKEVMCEWVKHILPKDLVSGGFLDRFYAESKEMAPYCCEMTYYTNSVPEYFCLMHPNAQIDNAWYWRDNSGVVNCGLLDWSGVSLGQIPVCIAGAWIGAEAGMMDEHEESLIRCFIDEYANVTGFRFDFDDLYLHFKLAQATVVFGCASNVGMMLRRLMPKDAWPKVKSRKDPEVDGTFLVRCYYVQMELFIGMWPKRSPYKFFSRWLERTRLPRK